MERVLQMARLEKEDIGLKKESVDVHELIQDAVKANAISSKAVISLNLQAQRSQLTADKLHLTNVFLTCWIMPSNTIQTHQKLQ